MPTQLGLVVAAGAADVLVAAAKTPAAPRRVGGWRWVSGLLTAAAVALPAFGLPLDPLLVVVLVVNVAGHRVKLVAHTMAQHECADAFQGRVFAVNDPAFDLTYVPGMVATSAFMPNDGRSPALLGAAAVGLGCLAVAATRRARDAATTPRSRRGRCP